MNIPKEINIFKSSANNMKLVHLELLSSINENIKEYSFEIYDNNGYVYKGKQNMKCKDVNPIITFINYGYKCFVKIKVIYEKIGLFEDTTENKKEYNFFYEENQLRRGFDDVFSYDINFFDKNYCAININD